MYHNPKYIVSVADYLLLKNYHLYKIQIKEDVTEYIWEYVTYSKGTK